MGHLDEVTNRTVQAESHRYKFGYVEFEGEEGYSLLCEILAAILPMSLN